MVEETEEVPQVEVKEEDINLKFLSHFSLILLFFPHAHPLRFAPHSEQNPEDVAFLIPHLGHSVM